MGNRILMTEAYSSLENMVRYYGDGRRNGSQIPFNFELITRTNITSNAVDFKARIDAWLNGMPKGVRANWVVCERRRLLSMLFQSLTISLSSFSLAIMTTAD